MNNPIIIQDLEDSTVIWLQKEAKRRNVDVETLVIELINAEMRHEVESTPLTAYHDLDTLAGTWDPEQTEQFMKAIGDFTLYNTI